MVVLTGYESYFASGGTKESLLAIQAGEARFTDNRIYEIALKSKLPVIAAMQGHGIGAGWTLGLMADVVVMSEESRYVSPYMSYGFTPGAGATWVMGRKLGEDIGRESLLSGEVYGGGELKRRGVQVRVVKREEVEERAMGMARAMAGQSGEQLRRMKQVWRRRWRRSWRRRMGWKWRCMRRRLWGRRRRWSGSKRTFTTRRWSQQRR